MCDASTYTFMTRTADPKSGLLDLWTVTEADGTVHRAQRAEAGPLADRLDGVIDGPFHVRRFDGGLERCDFVRPKSYAPARRAGV